MTVIVMVASHRPQTAVCHIIACTHARTHTVYRRQLASDRQAQKLIIPHLHPSTELS